MTHKLGTWVLVLGLLELGLAHPVRASQAPGAISGYVRNASGTPQMGAVVEILGSEVLGSSSRSITTFTDGLGFYSAAGLLPGVYSVKVTAPSFLPAVLERIGVISGARLKVNVTLNTLLGALDVGRIRAVPDDEDWKWTLRSVANRPILRVFDDPPAATTTTVEVPNGEVPAVVAERAPEKAAHPLRGSLSFVAGTSNDGYGSGSDMSTGFSLERSIFSTGRVGMSGNVGYGDGMPDAAFRATYAHVLADGSQPTFALTMRRFAPSDPNLHNAALQAMALAMGDSFTAGDVLELNVGSEIQTIQFLGRVSAFRPYGSARLHLSPNTILTYSYASSLPDTRVDKGFDSAPPDMSESNPRVSLQNYSAKIERAHHQELSLSRRLGNTSVQVAAFSDRVGDTALTGAGEVTASGGYLLPDVYSGTFSYTGGTLDTAGLRAVLQHKFSSDLTGTLDYAWGGVLNLGQPDISLQNAQQSITTVRRQAMAVKFNGTVSRTHTRWIASYRWVNGQALTPVDMFDASPGQSDPYLSLFVRQPIPSMGFLPGHMEALIEVRNLLAQGYVPVLGQDGQTVYLVQAARCVRAGLAFSF